MMKKVLITIFLVIAILTVTGLVFIPQQAEAGILPDLSTGAYFTEAVAWILNIVQGIVSLFVTASATLLSLSIKLTLNISELYNATPAIKNIWVIVRNISSMLIIFMLLFSSIQTILGIGNSNIKKLIGNIIMAGLLINFSLFFTKVLIDASNLVSLQFYRAIAPEYASQDLRGWQSAYYDGGLSNIFMASLRIQNIYHPGNTDIKKIGEKGESAVFVSMIVATAGGIVMMLFAAISFFGAAIAFTIRTGFLLLLMAFSPIYFAGMIFPQVKKDLSDRWRDELVKQLLFMPIYLFLMYVALRVITDEGFMSFIQGSDMSDKGALVVLIGIIVQYVIAIIFINIPLIAAIKFGAIGTEFAKGLTSDLKGKIYGTPGFLGQHTLGRGAKLAQGSFNSSAIAAKNPNLAILANKTFNKVASSTFGGSKGGYDKRYKDYVKDRENLLNKEIKISDSYKQSYIDNGKKNWEKDNADITKKIKIQNELIADGTNSEDEKMVATKELVKLQAEEAARKNAYINQEQDKYLADKALKERKEEVAKAIEKQTKFGIFTNKARKEAAESFRKEANKSEEKKLLDKLRELAKNAEKESGESGGGGEKGKK